MEFLVAGVQLTQARCYLKCPWLWAGANAALLIFLPNLLWMAHQDLISLQKLSAAHARGVGNGYYSPLVWMYVVPLVGFLVLQGVVIIQPLLTPC